MRLRCPQATAFRPLKSRDNCSPCVVQLKSRRTFSKSHEPGRKRTEIAVLGGGISGLVSAYRLSNDLPRAHITLYEKTERLGGWVDTERVEVDGGTVFFEHGPHTIRPGDAASLAVLKLIRELDLQDEIIRISSNAAAARNRYIYYPDHLVRLPYPLPGASALMNIVRNSTMVATEPLFGFPGSVPTLIKEIWQPPRSPLIQDESIGSFLSRRFGPLLVDNIVSAAFHGIYAGDIYQLSARSLLPLLWFLDSRRIGLLKGFFLLQRNGKPIPRRDYELWKLHMDQPPLEMAGTSVYTFRRGIYELVDALVKHLADKDNVTIKTNTTISRLRRQPQLTDGFEVQLRHGRQSDGPERHHYVLSTLSPKSTVELVSTQETGKENGKLDIPSTAVTVMVVNLWFPTPKLLPIDGFGYLIPRSIPFEQNPEQALGVIFASESSPGQDTVTGTKLTVMIGGHWWMGLDSYPSEDEALQMTWSLLERHLGILERPARVSVSLQQDCIPQYTVGHRARVRKLHDFLNQFGGHIRVAGSWYDGVGLNDCVRSASDVTRDIAATIRGESRKENLTGLEHAIEDPEIALMRIDRTGTPSVFKVA